MPEVFLIQSQALGPLPFDPDFEIARKPYWVHLEVEAEETKEWLESEANLVEGAQEALVAIGTRPRCLQLGEALVLNLRGANLNEGADPEDMIALRLYVEESRVISLSRDRLKTVSRLELLYRKERGPTEIHRLVEECIEGLLARIEPVINELDEVLEKIEERVELGETRTCHSELGEVRRRIARLRRFLAPQRDSLLKLAKITDTWFEADSTRFNNFADEASRQVDMISELNSRASITQEQVAGLLSDELNRKLYLLSIVTGIFLPLGVITGLLGINVGGMPGVESPSAFTIVCAIIFATVLIEVYFLKRLKWL